MRQAQQSRGGARTHDGERLRRRIGAPARLGSVKRRHARDGTRAIWRAVGRNGAVRNGERRRQQQHNSHRSRSVAVFGDVALRHRSKARARLKDEQTNLRSSWRRCTKTPSLVRLLF